MKIIGSNTPPEVLALASEFIDVLGYAPETTPYLENAFISVAPLRYGGGMKGKVGEAMSFGLPVVTTSYGAEGFGLTPGKDLLIGDSAESFAAQVIALLGDADLYARIAKSGYDFIGQHYSIAIVAPMLDSSLGRLALIPQHKIPLTRRLMMSCKYLYSRHVAWRMTKVHRN
jgi:glycosyltransferase involved in cell wall biosynthesis